MLRADFSLDCFSRSGRDCRSSADRSLSGLACIGLVRVGCWRLIRHRRQALRQNIYRPHRTSLGHAWFSVFFLGNDQHFFELAQIGGGLDPDIQKQSAPGETCVTVPTGNPSGRSGRRRWSARSRRAALFVGHNFSRTTSPDGVPRSTPCSRDFSRIAPTPLLWSLISNTCDVELKDPQDLAHHAVRGDHRHVRLMPSRFPLSI